MSTFSAVDYIKSANEREQATRDGKTVEPKPAAAVEPKPADAKPADGTKPADEQHDADGHRVSRSTRRLLRQLGEAEGRAKVLEEMVKGNQVAGDKKPAAAAEDDPEPQAKDFTDYNKFQAELTKWQARKETAKQLGDSQQIEAFKTQMKAMDDKAAEDRKTLPDFDQVAEAAMEDGPEFIPDEHPNLMGLLATSDVKAFVLYHLAKNPDEMERMLALSKTPGEQIRQFARLEGRVEKLYGSEKKPDEKKPEEKKAETAAERDAKKPKPSESAAAHGGSAPPTQVSPVLADGKTLNPAWKEQANAREGRRR